MWSGEEDFKPLLQKALQKPSKGSLTAVTDVAVRDEKWVGPSHEPMHVPEPLVMSCHRCEVMLSATFTCPLQCYKSVCYDLEKATKRVHKKQRLNVLYIISDICRKSKSRLGSKDKYGMPILSICSQSVAATMRGTF